MEVNIFDKIITHRVGKFSISITILRRRKFIKIMPYNLVNYFQI